MTKTVFARFEIVCLISFIALINTLPAQVVSDPDPYHKSYQVEDGLPSNMVMYLFNDSKGLMWVGTENGLCYYNGRDFTTIGIENVKELMVVLVSESPSGQIWFMTVYGGLYYVENDKAYPHILEKELLEYHFGYYVPNKMVFENDTTIYIASSRSRIKIKGKEFSVEDSQILISADPITQPGFITINSTLLGYYSKIPDFLNDTLSGYAKVNVHFMDEKSLSSLIEFSAVQSVSPVGYAANTNKTFAIAISPIGMLANYKKKWHRIETEKLVTNSLFFENDSTLWYGTEEGGLYKQIFDQKSVRYFANHTVYSVAKDFENGLWIGTKNNGLIYIPSQEVEIIKPIDDQTEIHIIKNFSNLLVGVSNAFSMFQGNKIIDQVTTEHIRFFPNSNLSNDSCECMINRSNDGTQLTCFNWRTRRITQRKAGGTGIANGIVINGDTMLPANSGIYYLGDRDKIKFIRTINFPDSLGKKDRRFLPKNGSLYKLSENEFWITTQFGVDVFELDSKNDTINFRKSYSVESGIKEIFHNGSKTIGVSRTGFYFYLDKISDQFLSIPNVDQVGLYHVTRISDSAVLISSNRGLLRMTWSDGQNWPSIENVSQRIGIQTGMITDIEVIKDTVYLLSSNQILAFHLSLLDKHSNQLGRIALTQTSSGSQIRTNDKIQFHVHYVSFKMASAYHYTYRLLPLRDEWTTNKTNELQFDNLPSGSYTLEVKSNLGQLATSSFTVTPYFYETWWFISLCIFIFISLLYTPIFFRMKLRNSEIRLQQERDHLKLHGLTDQLKPHFVFNALTSIQSYILKNEPLESSEYLSKFAQYIRNALINSKSENTGLLQALESLKSYLELEQMRLKNSFEYVIDIEEGLNLREIQIPVMLLQPYVENSVIHAMSIIDYKGQISISITQPERTYISILITDNGPGFLSKSNGHHSSGIGTSVNRERIEVINKLHRKMYSVKINQRADQDGVAVVIQIPTFDV